MEITDLTIDQIKTIMLDHAAKGGFLATLPAQIWRITGVMVSCSYLDKIRDDDFLRTKSVAKGLCGEYWNAMMLQAAIPAAVWKFIATNVMDWREHKDVKIDSINTNVNVETSPEESRKELEKLKAEIAERV